ncbi:hypothetical protein [Streptomyces sp. CL12-4]|uniref:hypothetical protein n=1 Tax=Streptomyces sp. CL12-4 TaxID=2810306 RepID=UPI001EFB87F7|nr:hypothetical protein [Streptomyces sp. CL12-4]MCG8968756.1 hypothetical protein [Streptomyces sp. CL12-4]
MPDGEVAAGAEFDWDVPEDPEGDASDVLDVPEASDPPEVAEVPDPVPPVAVGSGDWAADVPVPVPAVVVSADRVSADGTDAAGCAAASDLACEAAATGCRALAESVWVATASECRCEVPVVEDRELVEEGLRCLPVPAVGSSTV